MNISLIAISDIRTTYYDDITLHPDRLLEDLIFIYHPELLPGYSLRYYAPMK
jgi:iron complex transport system substrate-binding protein